MLAAVDFTGGPGTADLMTAVAILKNLNASGGRKVPADAPASFVPARYAEYLEKARKASDDTGFRHYWELCVILGLRDGLRSGDIFVPGSRRYADPSTYLYTPGQWMPKQGEYCRWSASLPGPPTRSPRARKSSMPRWPNSRAPWPARCPTTPGTVRLDGDDKLIIPKLTAEDVPAEARELKDELAGRCRSRRSPRC